MVCQDNRCSPSDQQASRQRSFTFLVCGFSKMTLALAEEDCKSRAAAQLAKARLSLFELSPACAREASRTRTRRIHRADAAAELLALLLGFCIEDGNTERTYSHGVRSRRVGHRASGCGRSWHVALVNILCLRATYATLRLSASCYDACAQQRADFNLQSYRKQSHFHLRFIATGAVG